MKVLVKVTDREGHEDEKQEFEGDFAVLACLKDEGDGFNAGSLVAGKAGDKRITLRALGEHMSDMIEELSDDHEEMVKLAGTFAAGVIARTRQKFFETEKKE